MRISLDDAIEIINNNIHFLGFEEISIYDSMGRRLAEDINAELDNPPFDRSPYDGYAVRADDTGNNIKLKVIGSSMAGNPCNLKVSCSEAVRIMTGGVIPEGADCVVPQENTDYGEKCVLINREFRPYDNYIKKGEDFCKGQLLIATGTKIKSSAAALAASSGKSNLKVFRQLKAAVISTGDEIVNPGQTLNKGQIYNTNLIYTVMRLEELGVKTVFETSAGDNISDIQGKIKEACEISDLVVTTGGVSVGTKDLVPDALNCIGAKTLFHGIDIKPGMPTLLALYNTIPILGLSGNPFAAAVGLEVIGRPLISSLNGDKWLLPERKKAVIKNGYTKFSQSRRFIKAIEADGMVTVLDSQSNGSIRTTAQCNCYIDVAQGTECLKPGDSVVIFNV